jgi:hypothetical protein
MTPLEQWCLWNNDAFGTMMPLEQWCLHGTVYLQSLIVSRQLSERVSSFLPLPHYHSVITPPVGSMPRCWQTPVGGRWSDLLVINRLPHASLTSKRATTVANTSDASLDHPTLTRALYTHNQQAAAESVAGWWRLEQWRTPRLHATSRARCL